MQVRSGRPSGGAHIADQFSLPQHRSFCHGNQIAVCIKSRQSTAVADERIVSVNIRPANLTHCSGPSGGDTRTLGCRQVQPRMKVQFAGNRVNPVPKNTGNSSPFQWQKRFCTDRHRRKQTPFRRRILGSASTGTLTGRYPPIPVSPVDAACSSSPLFPYCSM